MRQIKRISLMGLTFFLVLTSCWAGSAPLNKEFLLKPKTSITIAGTDLVITLDSTGHAWKMNGEADAVLVDLTVTYAKSEPQTIRFFIDDFNKADDVTHRIGPYTIEVLRADPFGNKGATLRVRK